MAKLDIHWFALAALLLLLAAGVILYALGYADPAFALVGAAMGIALPQAVKRAPEEPMVPPSKRAGGS